MAYIGKSPIIGNFVKLDAITAVNGQAAYTMQNGGANFTDYESVNQFLVSLNGTIQAPTDSFTVSGSTLTFASNLATGDVIDFIMVFGNSLSAGVPTDATITAAKLTANAITGQTAETSIADSDTILIHDDSASALRKMTKANFVSGVGGAMTPAFQAVRTSSQNFTDQSEVKAQFDVETFDTASAYDNSSNYRFTPQTAGKYYVYTRCQIDCQAASNLKNAAASIYKNGSTHLQSEMNEADNQAQNLNVSVHGIVDMNGSSDYLEVYVYANDESGNPRLKGSSFTESLFGAYKIIE